MASQAGGPWPAPRLRADLSPLLEPLALTEWASPSLQAEADSSPSLEFLAQAERVWRPVLRLRVESSLAARQRLPLCGD